MGLRISYDPSEYSIIVRLQELHVCQILLVPGIGAGIETSPEDNDFPEPLAVVLIDVEMNGPRLQWARKCVSDPQIEQSIMLPSGPTGFFFPEFPFLLRFYL